MTGETDLSDLSVSGRRGQPDWLVVGQPSRWCDSGPGGQSCGGGPLSLHVCE